MRIATRAPARAGCALALAVSILAGCGRVADDEGRRAGPTGQEPEPAWSKPSIIGRTDGVEPPALIRGTVTAVDPALGLAVLDVGQRHGVQRRHAFIVYRGDRYVGKLVVEEVLPDHCAAYYGRSMKADVAVGDRVTTRLLSPE